MSRCLIATSVCYSSLIVYFYFLWLVYIICVYLLFRRMGTVLMIYNVLFCKCTVLYGLTMLQIKNINKTISQHSSSFRGEWSLLNSHRRMKWWLVHEGPLCRAYNDRKHGSFWVKRDNRSIIVNLKILFVNFPLTGIPARFQSNSIGRKVGKKTNELLLHLKYCG